MSDISSVDGSPCGCCAGVQDSTPQALSNRPGLSAIATRIGRQGDFKASLQAGLSSAAYPALSRLLTRDGDDFTIGLIDAFACAADVLTFYRERIANENYLRTATERVSLQELGKLIGYRMRPGLAAEAWLAFSVETPPQAPPGSSAEPGAFVTGVPARIALDRGIEVQSIPGPNETPQTFETVEALAEARPEWNAARPWFSETRLPVQGDVGTWISGVRNNLKPGDALVFVDPAFIASPSTPNEHWDFRVLSAVQVDAANDRTQVSWLRGLGSTSPAMTPAANPLVFALRRRAGVFGNNAPMWASMPAVFKDQYPGGTKTGGGYTDDWPAFNASGAAPNGTQAWVDLDAVVADAAAGGLAVLAKGDYNRASEGGAGTYVELYVVRGNADVSRAAFAISAKVTRLELEGQNFSSRFYGYPRETSVYTASEALALADTPVDDDIADDLLALDLGADGLLPGRRLIVRGDASADGSALVHQATIAAVTPQGARCTLRIDPPLPTALQRSSVVAHLNVVPASQGKTVAQILGAGSAAQAFQRFELKQLPLTWRAAPTESGARAELTLRVGEVQWSERASLYGAAPAERSYALETDAAGRLFAVFGDGVQGARLPSGQNNVRASYRKGLGSAGNVAAQSLSQLVSRPLGLKGVTNPVAASGGTDPEAEDEARASMPLATRTLGRVVSLPDYADFALAYPGIAKAQAAVLALTGGRCIVVTVAAPPGQALDESSPVWTNLLAALKAGGDPLVPVRLVAARLSTFRIGIKVACDPAYEAKAVLAGVEAALRAAFGFEQRGLGQPVQQSEVIAAAQAVAGVVAVDLDRLYGGSQPAAQTQPSLQTRLLADRMQALAGGAQPAELLTLDPAPLDSLETM
ncbi:MAG: putative baseplate assembly protein [Burkholderiales bacterium]|nr:putative baseplate assembly protein [Burkholderiales bacterium]